MKNALLLSLSLHVAAGLVWSLVVEITQVRFVPRQMYTVNIITPAELPKAQPAAVVKQPEPQAQEEIKQEEVAPPPEKPKPKAVKKTMPTTDPKKADLAEETQSEGQEAEAVSTGDISLDGQDFPFAYYITNIRRKIAAYWRVQGESSQEKFCVVYFRIQRNGLVVSPSIETSSGNLVFDQAALRAVHQASPLPALPPAYADDELGVHFSFAYRKE